MKHVLVWFLILTLALSATALAQNDIGAPDTIRIECPIELSPVAVDDSFGIPIYLIASQ